MTDKPVTGIQNDSTANVGRGESDSSYGDLVVEQAIKNIACLRAFYEDHRPRQVKDQRPPNGPCLVWLDISRRWMAARNDPSTNFAPETWWMPMPPPPQKLSPLTNPPPPVKSTKE